MLCVVLFRSCYRVEIDLRIDMASSVDIPIPTRFEMTGNVFDNWSTFISEWRVYESAAELSKMPARRHAAIFLTFLGRQAWELLSSLKFDFQQDDVEKLMAGVARICVGDAMSDNADERAPTARKAPTYHEQPGSTSGDGVLKKSGALQDQTANVEIRVEEQRPATSCQSPGEVSCVDEPASDCTSTSMMLDTASERGRASDDLSITSWEMATLPTLPTQVEYNS